MSALRIDRELRETYMHSIFPVTDEERFPKKEDLPGISLTFGNFAQTHTSNRGVGSHW
jgi:hypothetical protein